MGEHVLPLRLAPGGGREYHKTPLYAPQEVAMDDRLSGDELYPFMDEAKTLTRGLRHHER